MQAYIVLGVMGLMTIGFVLNKWPFGLITMTSCAILGVTQVLEPAEMFSGLANPFVVMLAGSFIVMGSLNKTPLIDAIQKKILAMQNGKSGALLMAIFVVSVIILATFLPGPSLLVILIAMVGNLSSEGEVNPARIILPAAAITTIWNGRIPFGIGAGQFAVLNGFLEPYGTNYAVGMFDPMKAALFPGIALAIYSILFYKLLPHKTNKIEANASQSTEKTYVSKTKQYVIYATVIVMLTVMVLNKYTGNMMYIAPAVCSIFLIFAGIVTVPEAKNAMTVDLIFMLAGIFTLTAALSKTGAGEVLGDAIVSVAPGMTSEIGLIALFGGIAIVITNFMSNNATMYSLIPVAITTSLAANVNPIPVMLTIDVASKCACLLPCSSGEAAMCYGASGYSPKETWKFTLGAVALYYVTMVLGIYLLF